MGMSRAAKSSGGGEERPGWLEAGINDSTEAGVEAVVGAMIGAAQELELVADLRAQEGRGISGNQIPGNNTPSSVSYRRKRARSCAFSTSNSANRDFFRARAKRASSAFRSNRRRLASDMGTDAWANEDGNIDPFCGESSEFSSSSSSDEPASSADNARARLTRPCSKGECRTGTAVATSVVGGGRDGIVVGLFAKDDEGSFVRAAVGGTRETRA